MGIFSVPATFRATAVVALTALPLAALGATGFLEDQPGIASLHWTTGSVDLERSKGHLKIPEGARAVVGRDSDEFDAIEGPSAESGDEARVRFPRRGTLSYSFCRCGYAAATEPTGFDAANVLEVIEAFEKGEDGPSKTIGWGEPPHYDAAAHVMTWMTQNDYGEDGVADEADALIFGRRGRELVTAQTRAGDADSTLRELKIGIAAFAFPPGERYEDFVPGDSRAGTTNSAFFAVLGIGNAP